MTDQNVSKLGIASVTLKATAAALQRALVSPFKGDNGASTYFKDVMFAMMRTQLGSTNLAQDRYMNPLLPETYDKFAKKQGFAPDSVTLPSGCQAHWIGDRNAEKVILYLHGGGYVLAASEGHLQMLLDIKNELTNTAILVPAYYLAPEHIYPTQLRQATEALRYLVETEGRDPSKITVGGDSAGGNLTISLLSHLAHPHEQIPALTLPGTGKLHAAFLISPWCSFNTHTPAYVTNAEKDMFDARALSRWSSAFLGSNSPFAGDFYSEPVLAPASWWEKTAEVVDEVLIWGGANEILIDGIEEFARRFEKGFGGKGGRVTTVVTERAAHVEYVVDKMFGYGDDAGTGAGKTIKSWLKAKL